MVFLDYAMPGIDGLETACLVQDQMPEVRVVMVSASRNPAVEKAARYFGAVHFLKKPFFAREVDKAMHLALDLPLTSFMLEPEKVESDQLEPPCSNSAPPPAAHMWMARFSTASAASFTASDRVGWAWQVRAMSSAEAPNSIATPHSAISSPASGPMMWAPRTRSVVCVGEDLHEAVGRAVDLGAAVGRERELADLVGDARRLQLLLGLADGGDSGTV